MIFKLTITRSDRVRVGPRGVPHEWHFDVPNAESAQTFLLRQGVSYRVERIAELPWGFHLDDAGDLRNCWIGG